MSNISTSNIVKYCGNRLRCCIIDMVCMEKEEQYFCSFRTISYYKSVIIFRAHLLIAIDIWQNQRSSCLRKEEEEEIYSDSPACWGFGRNSTQVITRKCSFIIATLFTAKANNAICEAQVISHSKKQFPKMAQGLKCGIKRTIRTSFSIINP